MAAKLTRLTHKIAIKLHLVPESCTICSSRYRRPVLKLLDTPSYIFAGAGNFSRHHVQTGSGTHPTSYPVDTEGSFSGGKADGA